MNTVLKTPTCIHSYCSLMPFPNKLTFSFVMTITSTHNLLNTSLFRHLTCMYNGCWLLNLSDTTTYCEYINNCPTRCNTKQSIILQVHSTFQGCLTVHLPHEIMLNAILMQQGNFIYVFLALHVSGK